MADFVRKQIDELRKKLLDLSRRNRMLNYRESKRVGVEVLGEDSASLYKLLIEDAKRMSFVGVPDPVRIAPKTGRLFHDDDKVAEAIHREAAEDELGAYLENAAMPVDQLDTKLNTRELESVLQPKLRTILREARTANEELGINTLFLTLGMLEWSEGDEKPARAPLLFVPVSLEQQSNGSMRLIHDGSDVGSNLPLEAKMRELNLRMPAWDDEKGVMTYLSEVESTVASFEHWVVHRDEVHLDFFNYEKYAMYVDLGGENWPAGRKPWENEDLCAIFGTGYSPGDSAVSDTTHLDSARSVTESHEVFDADGSQTIALIRAAEGFSMVVEGPPGTGKSQTIANMIAEAVSAGKTVLFVSAKRAALDVVKRRLTDADLGPMCLDMHDKMTNRREFYAEIKRTVDRSVSLRDEEEKVARLTEIRGILNEHSAAMNEPLPPYDCTPFEAMCRLARLPKETAEDREGRIEFADLRFLTSRDLAAVQPKIRALQERLGAVGVPQAHPFWGAEIDYLDPARKLDIEEDIRVAEDQIAPALDAWRVATRALQVEVPPTLNQIKVLLECVRRVETAPNLASVNLTLDSWIKDSPALKEALGHLRTWQTHQRTLRKVLQPGAWGRDVSGLAQVFAQYGSAWYRSVVPAFRAANSDCDGLLLPGAATGPGERLAILRALLTAQAAERELTRVQPTMAKYFGEQWRGNDSDPDALDSLLAWVIDLRVAIDHGAVPLGLIDLLTVGSPDPRIRSLVESAAEQLMSAVQAYHAVAADLAFPHDQSAGEDLHDLGARVARWRSSLPQLSEYISFAEARRQVADANLGCLVAVADRWPHAADRLETTFFRSYYSGVVREAMQLRPGLKTFERAGHEAAIAEFRSLDDFKLRYNRAQVRLAHQRRLPTFSNAVGNLNFLKVQCELQRRHKPIRWAMLQAGEAVQQIKPVFMMSPLSVAIHLPPEMPLFDMVIFDEASQIKPEDALCAIARAKQCIVVGDTRQMPPTSFFDRLVEEDEEPDEPEATFAAEARKVESILSLMSAVVQGQVRRPDLRWHYRSIHPRLIQPSNEMFYNNRLLVFPSAGDVHEGREIGLILHHHPETVYEAGSRLRINRAEADLVARRVLEIITTSPEDSLLVAAMNKPQADLIYDEVTKLERTNPEAFAEYRRRHPHEPLDVKNLETVQGDERDVVIVSVTYGRDSTGAIRQQYGPLLQDGGERRLNVLFTRARRRCEVFSNLAPDDIRVDSGKPGVVTLRKYLQFAQSGRLDITAPTGAGAESPFEEEVADALRDLGYETHCQIGSEGFRIDLGVVDPKTPGRYVLGIECDGATYHSARSARDRDKLRQQVLEKRGWVIHRIWSHDWWQDRDGEIRRLVDVIHGAPASPAVATLEAPILDEQPSRPTQALNRPYEAAATEVLKNEAELVRYVGRVIQVEGPIHRDLLFIRVRNAAGYTSARGSTRTWLDNIINQGVAHAKQTDDAIYAEEAQLTTPRDWSTRPTAEKRIDFVTEPEIRAALRAVVGSSFGIGESDAVTAAAKLLGFKASEKTALSIQTFLATMIAIEEVARSADGILKLPGR